MHSLAVYDLASAVLRGRRPPHARRRRAYAAPLPVWRRVLGFEGCAVQFGHASIAAGIADELPDAVRVLLREETSRALRHGLLVHRQLPAVAALAVEHGIRIVALKGAARLLAGEPPGTRAIADIDLLTAPADADRLHRLLQAELGYTVQAGAGAPHHLVGLVRPGCLGIEVHHRLSPDRCALDDAILARTRRLEVGGIPIDVPGPAELLLHALEHAAGVNWMGRYRLRDICDTAALCTASVSPSVLSAYVRSSPVRRALETLLSAAHDMQPLAPRARKHAWSTVRRVSRARIALAVRPAGARAAERVFRYTGVLAEGSPATIWRAGTELLARGLAAAWR